MIRFFMFFSVFAMVVSTMIFIFFQSTVPFSKFTYLLIISWSAIAVDVLYDKLKKTKSGK
jgi:hypothetical protein